MPQTTESIAKYMIGFFAGLGIGYLAGNKFVQKPTESINSDDIQALAIPTDCRPIIKNSLPRVGIVSSKPQRTNQLLEAFPVNQLHTHIEQWGIQIYIVEYEGMPLFIATTPMGDSGSFLAFEEMYSAGAECIIRYGSNDYKVEHYTEEDWKLVTLVTMADNLIGPMHDVGVPKSELGKTLFASDQLIETIARKAQSKSINIHRSVCHNTSAYHASNYSQLFPRYQTNISLRRQQLEKNPAYKDLKHSSDMETAALFYAAELSGKAAATVLQTIIKHGGKREEDCDYAEQIKQDRLKIFLPLLCESLKEWHENNPCNSSNQFNFK